MRAWQLGSIIFFILVAIAAVAIRGVVIGTRLRVIGGACLGLAIAGASARVPLPDFPRIWILPPLLLLCAYWTSGGLFVAPMLTFERQLLRADAALYIDRIAAVMPRGVAEFLEFAYSGIYLIIPIALLVALSTGEDADHFWNVILLTDYICFGFLPLIQTRPPRAFRTGSPWRSTWRRVNLSMLNAASIEVNTFPSGHAAEALAAALIVSNAPVPIGALMYFSAFAISAGAVFGRYHYALDALAGWAVALVVWMFV